MIVAYFVQHLIRIVQHVQIQQHVHLVLLLLIILVDNNASYVLILSVIVKNVQVVKIAQNVQQDFT